MALPFLMIALSSVVPPASAARSYVSYTLDSLDLNRVAYSLSDNEKTKFFQSEFGFTWNDEDSSTLKWRPQGLSGTATAGLRDFVVVSWYGREEESYADRGARVSAVDISDLDAIRYRHVLLVDEQYETFSGLHAGGLAVSPSDGLLHVPDSRDGAKRVHTFNMSEILFVPEEDRDQFYTYAYIMVRKSSYDVPITPSFMSYDWGVNKILLGTFYQCSSYHVDSTGCLSGSSNRLSWYTVGQVGSSSPSCAPLYSEMQGAACATDPTSENGQRILWTASSYGSGHDSHLHITRMDSGACQGADSDDNVSKTDSKTIIYPPGLEDMHVSGSEGRYPDYLWMHTEFGTNDGSNNVRTVFATKLSNML